MRAVGILLPALLLCSVRFAAGEVELTVIYTADTHAALYPCDCPFEPDGGIARRATMIRRIRKQAQGSVLLVDAGGAVAGGLYDEYSVSPELDSLRQEYYLQALVEMAYDAVGVGGDELRAALELPWVFGGTPRNVDPFGGILRGVAQVDPPPSHVRSPHFFSANLMVHELMDSTWPGKLAVKKIRNGARVAFFALSPPNAKFDVSNPVAAARRVIRRRQATDADAIICLAPIGEAEAARLAREVPQIDLIIVGGKRQTRRDSFYVGRTLVCLPHFQGRRLGVATAKITRGERPRFSSKVIRLSPEVPDDPEMKKLLAEYESRAAPLRAQAPAVEIDLYKMAYCPFSKEAERTLAEVVKKLPGRVKVTPYFIVERQADGSLESLHGPAELAEDLRQAAIARFHPDLYWDYVLWRMDNPDGDWADAARRLGILPARIRGAVASGESERILRAHLKRTEALHIEASPTIFINRRRLDVEPLRGPILLAICRALRAADGTADKSEAQAALCGQVPACFRDADCRRPGRVSECVDPGKRDARCVHHEPRPYRLTVVTDRRAVHSAAEENIESLLRLMPGGEVVRIDYASGEGRVLIARHKISRLPAYLLDARARRTRKFPYIASAAQPSGDGGWFLIAPDKVSSHQFIGRERKPGRIELFVAPNHRQAAEVVTELYRRLGEMGVVPQVHLRYALYRDAQERIAAQGGIAEIEESLRQIGVRRAFPEKFIPYVLERAKVPGSSWWDGACRAVGLDLEAVKAAAQDPRSLAELERDIKLLQSVGAKGPTVFLVENQEVVPIAGRASLQRLLEKVGARRASQ